MFKKFTENVHKKNPIIHNITNYVTVNDCANMLLACKASPIMSDDINEVSQITSICSGLTINIGTLNERTIQSMLKAGNTANELNHSVVLDPVGAGASDLRTNTAKKLLQEIKFDAVRANISEMKALYSGSASTKGVDANALDAVTDKNLDSAVSFAKSFAEKFSCVAAITGAIDIVCDKDKAFVIRNGHKMMSSVTGTGCQLSSLLCAYIAANKDDTLTATAAAVCAMGLCGEIAFKRMTAADGNSSYRNYIIDAMYNLTGEALDNGAKYEIR